MTAEFDLIVAGELNPDMLILGPNVRPAFGQVETVVDSITMQIGSSSAIAACGAARLGLRTAFVGVVGDDRFGVFMLEALGARGIDVSACRVDPTVPTGATVILSGGSDRAILTAIGTSDELSALDLPDSLLARGRHLHVGSTYLQRRLMSDLPGVFRRARSAGLTTSFDCNWDPTENWDGGIDALLGATDVFLPNLAEARLISGRPEAAAAADELARRASGGREKDRTFTLAIKLGEAGAMALRQGADREVVHAEAIPTAVVDSTGAGDSFDAGFLYGFIAGWSLGESLDLGAACGSLSVREIGGTAAQPTLEQACRALAAAGRRVPC